MLDKVASLPITQWNYIADAGASHIGPVAQDSHAAFGLNGNDDKHISVVDEGGVALVAIQALNQKQEREAKEKDARLRALEQELSELNRTLKHLVQGKK